MSVAKDFTNKNNSSTPTSSRGSQGAKRFGAVLRNEHNVDHRTPTRGNVAATNLTVNRRYDNKVGFSKFSKDSDPKPIGGPFKSASTMKNRTLNLDKYKHGK